MIIPIILCGGSGTRLWPLSRKAYPKQFLPLAGKDTLFQSTIKRVAGIPGCGSPVVVCNQDHRFLAAEQLRETGHKALSLLLEPVGRNTAPAVACAALDCMEKEGDPVLLVLPADHVIRDIDTFRKAVETGCPMAESGKLVTFGIVPDRPETGYGYIRRAEPLGAGHTAFRVERFVEKPDIEIARKYVDSGDYYWNSGMFMFKASTYLDELSGLAPEMSDACRDAYEKAVMDLDFVRLDAGAFESCPGDSIDYAVMEKTGEAVVIPLDAGWNDLGAWSSLMDTDTLDEAGNVLLGDVVAEDVRNSYLRSEHRLLTALGIDDLIIVETTDAVLVARRDKVQDVKAIVNRLKEAGREEAVFHRKVYRPWGTYEGIDISGRFQVKRITVNPGQVLSLQMHHHRAEHWIVVKGTAKVTRGDEELMLTEDQSTYIPLGTKHRLENPGVIPLELIEVQTGSYLGEDDIVRFEDVYGR
ncbi:MAG TPA: mannose-1-phosphate guanylyltransferase/mannose-6-phosphate isomerase [Thermodesulfobacteriaceae bacterium]|nr:mannose-1-phosphate guanylyltransferase/mannose-6-phosphate isomerase [Thermodesulfobacteriaceae bacterium]